MLFQLREELEMTNDKETQITALYDRCCKLDAEVRYRPENLTVTVLVPPPWDAISECKALSTQNTIKEWSEQYPNVVCYCFDSFSTLLYVL